MHSDAARARQGVQGSGPALRACSHAPMGPPLLTHFSPDFPITHRASRCAGPAVLACCSSLSHCLCWV